MFRAPRRIAAISTLIGLAACGACSKEEAAAPGRTDAVDDTVFRMPAFQKVRADVERIQQLVRLRPNDANLRFELGKTLLSGGVGTRGEAELERALALDPAHEEAALLMGQVLLSRGDLDALAALIDRSLAARETARLRALEAKLRVRKDPDDVASCERALHRALELDGTCREAQYEMALLDLRRGDAAGAIPLLEGVTRRDEAHLGAFFNLARAYRLAGREDDAAGAASIHRRLTILEELGQDAEPQSVEAYLAVAKVLGEGGERDAALAEIERGIARHPGSSILRVRRALALLQMGRVAEGRATFDDALKASPDDSMLLNQFAWYLATSCTEKADHARALRLAEKAVQVTRRSDANVLDTLAEARAALGDWQGARAALAEAVLLSPQDRALQRRQEEIERRAGSGR